MTSRFFHANLKSKLETDQQMLGLINDWFDER